LKVGVFGGTFDPIHWGHLVLAEEARAAAGLDTVLFVPAGVPPHKSGRPLTPYPHRLEMVRLAVAGVPEFLVSDVEGQGPGPHYSFETMTAIAAARPGDDLHFLLGSDSLLDLPGWREPKALVDRWPLVVLPRPGFDPAMANPAFMERAVIVGGITLSVSSTLLRRRIRRDLPVRFLVPDAVLDYARRNGLYRS